MFVSELISLAPSLRASGAIDVLVPPPALPQIAQSSVPRALRFTSPPGTVVELATIPASAPVLVKVTQDENSDVLPPGPVAVAVTDVPLPVAGSVTSKLAVPLPSVVTGAEPATVVPSPWPLGSQPWLRKNSIV